MENIMNTAKKNERKEIPESYRPMKAKPEIINLAQEMNSMNPAEVAISNINEFCDIVDRREIKVVGVKVRFSSESRGHLTEFGTNTDKAIAHKYITNGTVQLIADILKIDEPEIMGVRTNIVGAGIYDFVIGVVVDSFDDMPKHLPENTTMVICPPCRYAKMLINEKNVEGRKGYEERMNADEYFIAGFREDTEYVYDKEGMPFNTYDENGDILTKYEPVKIPKDESEKYDSMVFDIVSMPDILCACSVTEPDSEEFVIFKYFDVQDKVVSLESAKMYNDDYYGFPMPTGDDGKISSCFGSRVSSFEGLPDCVEGITIPGGIYLHISQLEVNGDNPSMPYGVAFGNMDELYLNKYPEYEKDNTREVIARFRQANCASVFVPLKLKV